MKKSLLFFVLLFVILNNHAQKIAIDSINYNSFFKKSDSIRSIGKTKDAIELQYALIEYCKNKISNPKIKEIELTKNYQSLSNIYAFTNDSLSLIYANKAIKYSIKTKNLKLIQRSFNHKYYSLYFGRNGLILNKTADSCIKYAKLLNNKKFLGEAYMHKCNALVELNKISQGENYCVKAENIFKKIETSKYLTQVYSNIANVFTKINDFEKANYYHLKGFEIAKKLKNRDYIIDDYHNLANDYLSLKKYKKAAEFFKKYVDSSDIQFKKLLKNKFTESEAKYKTLEKDKEIAKQQLLVAKQKNAKNKILIFGLLALLLGYGIFQRFYNKQKQKKLTTENELQKELEINELRTKFLGNIAHEIRTPLTLIAGNLELAKENINTKEKAIQNINIALINSKKVVEDANEILELLKFEKSKITIKSNTVNLDTTLKRIFFSFKSLAELKNIDLEYQSVIRNNFQTKIDVEKVEKILNNLISNALKYSPSNSKIIFNANIIDSNLVVKVTDFGQGIHFDETEKIFQRFYQASNSRSVGGIGIGLSLAKEFAELLKGTLSVESELTKGSTFTFCLPIVEVSNENVALEKEDALINRTDKYSQKNTVNNQQIQKQVRNDGSKKSKILIVEDNPEMNNYLVEILSKNYQCTTAFDGLEALQKMKGANFDLITSDIMMPNLDGFQFREKINEINEFKNIPFILISAKTLAEDKIKGFQLGIDDYVIKPFNKNELIARIDNLLTHKKAREKWTLDNKTLISNDESSDKKLLKKIETIVLENISNEDFKIDDLAKEVGYSQRQLTRILKQYSGMSPVKFILEIRLQKAYVNLQNRTFFSLSEIRYDVGITSASYFNKKFKERFGLMPNELLKV